MRGGYAAPHWRVWSLIDRFTHHAIEEPMSYTAIAIFATSRTECTFEAQAQARRWIEAECEAHADTFDAGQVLRNDPMRRVIAGYSRAEGWTLNG